MFSQLVSVGAAAGLGAIAVIVLKNGATGVFSNPWVTGSVATGFGACIVLNSRQLTPKKVFVGSVLGISAVGCGLTAVMASESIPTFLKVGIFGITALSGMSFIVALTIVTTVYVTILAVALWFITEYLKK